MNKLVKKDSTNVSVEIYIVDSTDGTPETGVVWNTAGIDLNYRRDGAAVVSITEADLATPSLTDPHLDGGFLHVSNGRYRLDVPDAAFATGVSQVTVGGTVTGMVVLPVTIQLVDFDPDDAVRMGQTALPNANADAAGGLPISDAGGLDLDAKLANTNEITVARMGALTDWIDGGRLDLLLDAIKVFTDASTAQTADNDILLTAIAGYLDTEIAAIVAAVITNAAGVDIAADIIALKAVADAIPTTAMRGTDNAATEAKQDIIDGIVDELKTAIITNAAGADVTADVAAVKAETANIVADTNELQTDWTNGGRLDLILDAIKSAKAGYRNVNYIDYSQTDGYATLPAIAALTRTGTWSCSFWFRLLGDPSANSSHPIFQYYVSSTDRITVRIESGSGAGKLVAGQYDGSYTMYQSVRSRLNDGQWHHGTVTCNAGTFLIYVDGREDTEAGTGGNIGSVDSLGYLSAATLFAEHHQHDLRFYDRVLTPKEIFDLRRYGMNASITNPPVVDDYIARYDMSDKNETSLVDLTGSYDATWVSYDSTLYQRHDGIPVRFNNMYFIGNSLSLDNAPQQLSGRTELCINTGEGLDYTVANPTTSNYDGTYVWGTALDIENYEMMAIQVFDEGQLITTEVSDIQTFIDKQPSLKMLMIHDGHPDASTVNTGTEIDKVLGTTVEYSTAALDEIVRQVRENNPGLIVFRNRVSEAVNQVKVDIDAAIDTGSLTTIGNPTYPSTALYRDNSHLNYTHGRYLSHQCSRRAMGLKPWRPGYPFTNHPVYTDTDAATMDYLDTVVARVFNGVATPDPTKIDTVDDITNQFAFTVANQVDANALTGGSGVSEAQIRKYFQLLVRKDSAIATDHSTELTAINADEGSGSGSYANSSDSLEAIRDRGDANWSAAAAGNPQLLLSTTISGVTSQKVFELTDGLDSADAANGAMVVITDAGSSTNKSYRFATDYSLSPDTLTIHSAPDFVIAIGDTVDIVAVDNTKYSGSTNVTWTSDDGTNPLDGVEVRISTDSAGNNVIKRGFTDNLGKVSFQVDPGTYYLWQELGGYTFTNPTTVVVTE